ncbi:MAG: hypothetical protein IT294_18750 [Deltaproteobacteria bacterium]|nr:hypothetical protein [Deltaproteobacteria bacterium]
MSAFAAIADDLTGACDVAAELAAAGLRARVVVEAGATAAPGDDGAVAVVNTQSRALTSDAAAARVRAALGARPARLVLKKIDTALRGHLGAELDAALDHLGATGFVLPAIPAAGRVTRGGCQWFGGRPLAETEFARDPEGPGAVSSVREVIARESRRVVEVLPRECLRRGGFAAEVARRREASVDCFVVDAESDDDVALAVEAITALPGTLCLAGSIALAAALAPRLGGGGPSGGAVEAPSPSQPVLVVNGSLHSRARAQADAVLAAGEAVAITVGAGAGAGARAAARRGAAALAAGRRVVAMPPAPGGVPAAGALRATEAALADAVAAIVADVRIGTLVMIGGETGHAILRRLEAGAIEVHGRIAPLVAYGTILGGTAAGTRLVTKGGSGGASGVIAEWLGEVARAAPRAAEGAT